MFHYHRYLSSVSILYITITYAARYYIIGQHYKHDYDDDDYAELCHTVI